MPQVLSKGKQGNRRGRRVDAGRVSFYYVFCGFTANFHGGIYRSENPLLCREPLEKEAITMPGNQRGTRYDGLAGGLVYGHHNDEQPAFMWLVNTADSSVTRWDPTVTPPGHGEHAGSFARR